MTTKLLSYSVKYHLNSVTDIRLMTPRNHEVYKFIKIIESDLESGRFTAAIEKLNTLITAKPDIGELYYYRAVANYHLNNLTEMLIDTWLCPFRQSYIQILSDSYLSELKQISPTDLLSKIIHEKNLDNKIYLLHTCLNTNIFTAHSFSTHDFQKQIVTELVAALKQRAVNHTKAHKPNEALADYNLAIRYNPSFAILYVYRAMVHSILGNSAAVKADLAMLRILDPSIITNQIYHKKMPVTPVVKTPDYSALHRPINDVITSFLSNYVPTLSHEGQNPPEITYFNEPIIQTHAEFISPELHRSESISAATAQLAEKSPASKPYISQPRLFPGIDYMIEAKPTEDLNPVKRYTKNN